MRCKVCEYSLWNTRGRTCPECGAPFLPSDFDFQPNSVQFCCPHCDQTYYGLDERGHLVPQAFDCVQCGNAINMDQMILRPHGDEAATRVDVNPWVTPDSGGWWKRWLVTVGWSMGVPHRLIRATPQNAGVGRAVGFLVTTNGLYMLVAFLPVFAIGLIGMLTNLSGGGGGMSPLLGMGIGFGIIGLTMLGVILVGGLLWAVVAHAILCMGGKPAFGMARTVEAVSYASGANVLNAVPCVSAYIGWLSWIWWIVSATLMVKEGQRVSGLRATTAVAGPPVVLGMAFMVLMVWWATVMMNAATAAGPAGGWPPGPAVLNVTTVNAEIVSDAITAYVDAHGRYPRHALQLVADSEASVDDFVLESSLTFSEDIVIGGKTLDWMRDTATPTEQQQFADAAADALPVDVVAHRVGDYVLTWHGVPPDSDNHFLWIVIEWPDPASNPPPAPGTMVTVVTVDGMTTQFTVELFEQMLDIQNQSRKKLGLAPLPHPSKVKHDKPAAGAMPL